MTADQDQWTPSDIAHPDTPEVDSEVSKRRTRPPAEARQKLELRGDREPQPVSTAAVQEQPEHSNKLHTVSHANPVAPPAQGLSVCEEVEQRLRDMARKCVECYHAYHAESGDELELTNSLHELRRVLARIEIEVAARHTDDSMQKAIPIPIHRSHQRGA